MNWNQKHILKCTDSWLILIKGLETGRDIIHTFSVTGSFILQKFERIALTEEALIEIIMTKSNVGSIWPSPGTGL